MAKMDAKKLLARGWTRTMMKRLLPKPESSFNGADIWDKRDVLRAEKTQAWQKARHSVKEMRAEIDVETYKKEAQKFAIKVLYDENYQANSLKAIADYQKSHFTEIPEMFKCPESASDEIKRRWEVNYIRHSQSNYDDLVAKIELIAKKDTPRRNALITFVHERVLDEIQKLYPALVDECDAQKALKYKMAFK